MKATFGNLSSKTQNLKGEKTRMKNKMFERIFPITVFVVLAMLWIPQLTLAADDWFQQSPSSKPPHRYAFGMTCIAEDLVVLFGGYHYHMRCWLNDTWVYNSKVNTWISKEPEGEKPSHRYNHRIAYIGDNKVLLFGGYSGRPSPSGFLDDTWMYDLSDNTWTNLNPSGDKPSARQGHEMVYIGNDHVLLFGGFDDGYMYVNDTWVYDLSDNTWINLNPSGDKPLARSGHAMAYMGNDQVFLFGGYGVGCYNDTWVYDVSDNGWTNLNPSGGPSPRWESKVAYIGGDRVLLFGGQDFSVVYYDDTWVYDFSDNSWVEVLTTTQPPARRAHGLSNTSLDGSGDLVLFGGSAHPIYYDDTWTFVGADTTPPEISVSVDPDELWPPNHKMRAITATVTVTDDSDPSPTVVLTSIVSNEPDNGLGDGDKPNDIQDAEIEEEDYEFSLRAERSGGGDGRIYTITYTATDASGNSQIASATVTVPHDKGKGKAAPGLLAFSVLSAYPQPCNPEAWIPYSLAKNVDVTIAIYNSSGRMIRTLQLGNQDAGTYISRGKAAYWDGKNDIGETVSSGVYFYRLKAGDFTATKRLVVLR